MEFKLFSAERTKQRYAVIVLMTGLFAYGVWRIFNDRSLTDWEDATKLIGSLFFVFYLVLPLLAVISIYRRKSEGVETVSFLIFFSIIGLEMRLFLYGPTFAFPRAWWSIVLILLIVFLMGGDLWHSIWFSSPGSKLVIPRRLFKVFLGLFLFFPIGFYLWIHVMAGLPYPEFTASSDEGAIESPKNNLPLPFSFQVDLPKSLKLFEVNSKDERIELKTEKNVWRLSSINKYDQDIRSVFHSSKTQIRSYLAERYGTLPNELKCSYFGTNPVHFFEIKRKDLWCAVSVAKPEQNGAVLVRVYIWDDAGAPLGSIEDYDASSGPKNWDWVYSVRRSESTWSPEKYSEAAKDCLTKRQKDLAGIFLASAVIADNEKTPRLKSLIEFLQKQGWNKSLAKFQLDEALRDYPQDPILKSIHLTGGVVK